MPLNPNKTILTKTPDQTSACQERRMSITTYDIRILRSLPHRFSPFSSSLTEQSFLERIKPNVTVLAAIIPGRHGKTVKAPAMFADLCHVPRVVAILPRAVSRARTHARTHARTYIHSQSAAVGRGAQ